MATEHPLQGQRRPAFERGDRNLVVVDLFAGCGGLTLGAAQAARDRRLALKVPLAVDFEQAPVTVFRKNFPKANVQVASVESYFDGALGAKPTVTELKTRKQVGDVDLLIGGPPCQGHSNLNNRTRRDDPKNRLYLRMARAAEVLRPRVMVVENVPAVVHDSQQVVARTRTHLERLGYKVAATRVELVRLGIPQTRRRHILLAVRTDALADGQSVADLLEFAPQPTRDLRWAIGDLEHADTERWFDAPSKMSSANRERIQWLIDENEVNLPNDRRPKCHRGDHSYVSMYGRLTWSQPAQTITSGFGSLGQGRYGHPSQPRTLTPHEAARIQGFPDYFQFDATVTRTQLSVIIGNAVPPALSRVLTTRLLETGILGHEAVAGLEESA
ncbi:DNA (cytosine-5)-methyltransferase 1 [Cellulosimicrobium cellulans]|uniref:DNA cytosine methyltransferase n=1 Tax=Cellulosimicrobium cellulans TaxID=1710 RepID=UPI0019582449|nr:DNA cytosine methyltransferase [Cellulosimicrobium cellulans]MBM7817780.1 DNA (cytosine-5)-methyltransferase 1 [Cellulosimicrobium cellulans]